MKQRILFIIFVLILGNTTLLAQKFTVKNAEGAKIKYEVLSSGDKTVQVTGGDRLDELIIPATVEYNGTIYKVTEIKRAAYSKRAGGKYMKRLVLPEGLISIGDKAFHGTLKKNDASIYIPSSVSYVGQDAFLYEDMWGVTLCDYKIENLPSIINTSNSKEFGIYTKCVSIYYAQNGSRKQVTNYAQSSANSSYNSDQQPVATLEQPKNLSSDVDVNVPSNATNNENTFAVIFANENYQEEAKVEYALNDGEMFKEYCQKVLGLPEDNIHIRKDATLNNIKAEISWLQKVAEAYKGQARFIVYYAGHGIPDEKTGTSYLLPIDGKGSMLETGYSLKQFYTQLGQMPTAGITVFMDACFSGSKRGDGMLASSRGVSIKAKPQVPQGKMVVFSAAQGDETAYPFKEKEHGLFTYYLLKKLQETKGNVSLGELGQFLIEQVSRKSIVANSKSQTPTIVPSGTMTDIWKNLKLK